MTAGADYIYECRTTGAYGLIAVDNLLGASDDADLDIYLQDTLADGHHVRIRFLTTTGR